MVASVTIVFLLGFRPASVYWFSWKKIDGILSFLFRRSMWTDVASISKSHGQFRTLTQSISCVEVWWLIWPILQFFSLQSHSVLIIIIFVADLSHEKELILSTYGELLINLCIRRWKIKQLSFFHSTFDFSYFRIRRITDKEPRMTLLSRQALEGNGNYDSQMRRVLRVSRGSKSAVSFSLPNDSRKISMRLNGSPFHVE